MFWWEKTYANDIYKFLVENSIYDDPSLISNFIISFYKDLYVEKLSFIYQDQIFGIVSNYISHIVSQFDNNLLTKILDYMEIESITFTLNMDNAPSLDGFWGSFYHNC